MAAALATVAPLIRHPLFALGIALRVVLLLTVTPMAVQQWYGPFMDQSAFDLSVDPWGSHLNSGGDPRAFPYGYAMWLVFLPMALVSRAIGLEMSLAYGLTMLAVDLLMLALLRRLTEAEDGRLLFFYWLSPIVIFATYWLGLNDLIPALFLVASLNALKIRAPGRAALSLGAAISAKLSMIVAAPFFFFYLIHNKKLRPYLRNFVLGLSVTLAVLQGGYFLSSSGRQMLFGNPELVKIYDLHMSLGNELTLYLLPLIYLLVLFWAWRIRRMSFELLLSLMGISFFLVLVLTPASPGWFVWVTPFLVLYQSNSDRVATILVATLGFLFIVLSLAISPTPTVDLLGIGPHINVASYLGLSSRFLSLWQTVLVATGLVIAARMLREGVQSNEFFLYSRKPLVIAIAGDSGSGKDTLANALQGLFGQHSVVKVSGDDYHLWDRRGPMWQAMTHLNPSANDLARFTHHVQSLAGGRDVLTGRYDHAVGILSKPTRLRSNDFIVVSGLHALYVPALRDIFDVKVFLDMDEGLRKYFKLQRDSSERRQSPEQIKQQLIQREADSLRFIRPQSRHADVVFSLRPISPEAFTRPDGQTKLKLHIRGRHNIYYDDLIRALIAICGLHVDRLEHAELGEQEIIVEGEVDPDDIALASKHGVPGLSDLLDLRPVWKEGLLGVMQLVLLSHVALAFRRRLRV